LKPQDAERPSRIRAYGAFVAIVLFDEINYLRVRQGVHARVDVEYQTRPRAAEVFNEIRPRFVPEGRGGSGSVVFRFGKTSINIVRRQVARRRATSGLPVYIVRVAPDIKRLAKLYAASKRLRNDFSFA